MDGGPAARAEAHGDLLAGPPDPRPPRRRRVPAIVTAGLPTVAVRMPDHPVALALIRAAERPIAAPSANRFGRLSPTHHDDVLSQLAGQVDAVIAGGPTPVGIESTVVSLAEEVPVVLRPGEPRSRRCGR